MKLSTSPNNRVIINVTNIGRNMSGIGIYSLNLLKELANLNPGFKFVVFANKNARTHLDKIKFPENFTIKWVPRYLSPDYKFRGHLLRLLYSNYLSLKYRRDLIFNTSQLEINFFRSNQLITIHDIIPLLFKQYHKKQYYYFKYLIHFALKRARHIITPSNHTKELLQQIYKIPAKRIQVIPHGVQSAYKNLAKLPAENPERFILFAGRVCPMKNVVRLIQAFFLLKEKIPHNLIIVGDGRQSLEEAVRDGRLSANDFEDRVIVKGYVSEEEMLSFMKRADLLLCPSLYEGFGLPPLEAMACGCPVVVSSAASLPEVCGNAAYYINPYDVENIAEGIFNMITNPDLKNHFIRRGIARSRAFEWKTSAEQHLRIIYKALNCQALPSVMPISKPKSEPLSQNVRIKIGVK